MPTVSEREERLVIAVYTLEVDGRPVVTFDEISLNRAADYVLSKWFLQTVAASGDPNCAALLQGKAALHVREATVVEKWLWSQNGDNALCFLGRPVDGNPNDQQGATRH